MKPFGLALAIATLIVSVVPRSTGAADCQFVLGFKALRDLVPEVVGDCRADQHYNPENGDALQESSRGLLVWRKADNFTAFTDGYRSWVNGPYGIQQRLNTERFDWERAEGTPGSIPAPTPTATPAPASRPRGEIWRPAVRTTWQWQLDTPVDTNVSAQVFDIDAVDNPASVVANLHAKGSRVIAYMSAGTWEDWRPDASRFPASVLGRGVDGWAGEKWLDIRKIDALAPIIQARLDMAVSKGFDGVEFDNVDGYDNGTGFPLTYADQIAYNIFLSQAAHSRGLSVGLKNDLDQVPDLLPYFDFAINEECFQYDECDALLPFIRAGKPVFHVEYSLPTSRFCARANALGLMSMKKNPDLDAWRAVCW